MADVKWTASQREAIDGRGNILVSAAAGSGKTATLSAKIMHLLSEEDASLSRFLIVTFTNAAAAELKERISKEITKAALHDKSMLRHKRDVDGADICTIHSISGSSSGWRTHGGCNVVRQSAKQFRSGTFYRQEK